jgi:RNA polymerase sigma factor (TIGR02999 family)
VTSPRPPEITQLLQGLSRPDGDPQSAEHLFRLVHRELHELASSLMRRERPAHTLQPTALVNEAYLRLAGAARLNWESRAHFFGIAARAMRQILVDHARERAAVKRGGHWQRVTLDEHIDAFAGSDVDLFELDHALSRLASLDERTARVVELRFFAGLTEEEIAHVLGISRRTVQREWWTAKMWLRRELAGEDGSHEL